MRRRAAIAEKDMAADEVLALESFLPYRLLVVTEQVSQFYARRYAADFGITIPESRVLTVIARFAPLSSREICERTAMVKSRVSVAVARLVAAGLLIRTVNTKDGRLLSLTLSRQGRALYRKIVPAALEMERHLVSGLGPAGRATLMRLLDGIETTLEADTMN